VIARALHAITPPIENQMVVRKALHEPVSVRNRTSLRTAHREIGKMARRSVPSGSPVLSEFSCCWFFTRRIIE
jgi:hypothetical protein